jgi:FlaG/FlaF family flagellin (archaellin)
MICRKDLAVSPVIGVLLMLVVTIIIAAVVSAFAGGLASDQSGTPQASIEVKEVIQQVLPYTSGGRNISNGLLFTHNGGDPFSISSIYIQLQSGTTTVTLNSTESLKTPNVLPSTVTSYIMPLTVSGAVSTDSDTLMQPGDKFMLFADNCVDWSAYNMGKGISWKSFSAMLNTQCEYKIIDKNSNNVIQQGTFVFSQ